MGCLKLRYYEKEERLNFLGLWKKSDGSKNREDYYPFGLTFNSYKRENSVPNNYKFSSKEEQNELELGWLDFGARMYDPAVGKFFVQDALADFRPDWTPYRYAFNNPINIVDPSGNYEIEITLSKDERKKLKEIDNRKERRSAKKAMIEEKKQVVREFVAQAKSLLDNDSDAKSAFVAFSGIKEGSDEWNNLWTENGKGPTLVSDGAKLKEGGASGYTEPGGRIGFNPFNDLGRNVLTTLHEYVHYGDDQRLSPFENAPNGIPGLKGFDGQQQRAALEEAYQRSSNDPDPKMRATLSSWGYEYGDYYKNGSVSGVELGYAFEKRAFGQVYTTSKDYLEFIVKYLNK